MSLGSKILLSIFSISILIATIGVTSNWYTNSILNQLVEKNVETTNMVELTANIENELFQSLITLIALKESTETEIPSIILQEPTEEMHLSNFAASFNRLEIQFSRLNSLHKLQPEFRYGHITRDIEELNSRFYFTSN